jgi:hypothetical protein
VQALAAGSGFFTSKLIYPEGGLVEDRRDGRGKVSRPKKYQNEGVSLKITQICLSIFILVSAWGTALAEDGINGSESGARSEISPVVESLNIKGIWTFSLGASGTITAVLYQSEDLIWGSSKFETPELMKGILSGSLSGDGVEIGTLFAAGDVLTLTLMEGTFSGDTISGTFSQIDSFGGETSGNFVGMRTSTETAGYAPLSGAEPASEDAVVSEISEGSGTENQAETVDETASGFTDVHQLSAGINPRILGYAAPVSGKSRII